ncbi:MAG: ABC transporter substrate-binding protein [Oscillospiraceae bacterium]
MGILIAADDSPDIVGYEWKSFPYGMSKNLYEPLNGLIDLESPLWSGMADIVDSFSYNGKRYYYPYRIATNYALNYNREVLKEYSLPDPYDLYCEGNWTWDTFEELLIDWCNADDEHIGYAGEGGMSFIATTGTKLISVNADGTITNNINDPNVTHAMEFCSSLYRNGLVYQDEFNEWVSPQVWARNSRRLLFLGMNPEWTYTAAASEIQNKQGVDNDILNTVSEFAFVPFPRDPSSDKYTIAYDTFGYMVARGAKNKKGALDWINLNRVYETDENVIANKKKDSVSPEKQFFASGKYKGCQKWTLIWDENQYNLWQDMMNPEKFNFVFDNCWGISDEINGVCDKILFDPIFSGESWTLSSGRER